MTEVAFARSGDVHIAYTTMGEGPIDLVYVQGASTHLEVELELPVFRRYCERLAEFTRLILFDKRGMGMSDRVPGATPMDERMDDIRAVLDAIGSESAAIMGGSEGGPLAILFAAAHPERTRALILQGAEVRELKDEDWPFGESSPEEHEAHLASIPERWGRGLGVEVRAGVHTGEVEMLPNGNVAGISVHVGARVAAMAAAGEVLVSSSVRDLVAGSGFSFVDRGVHALKGVAEERRLYAVAS